MYTIDYNSYRSIKGFNRRPRFLVLHYTAVNFTGSIAALTGPSVSSHYLVPDPTDPTYAAAGFSDLRIFNLVDESERAWHAGISAWAKRYNLNDTSIGVEIVYVATEEKGAFTFPPYNPAQIQAVKALAANIIQRYPDITPTHVVGHSDIAIGRKSDPGAAFPWKELYDAGIGAWYEEATKRRYQEQFSGKLPNKADIVTRLGLYGYDPKPANTEAGYQNLLRAFQLHFRPQKYDGEPDAETAAILYALVDRYFPGKAI